MLINLLNWKKSTKLIFNQFQILNFLAYQREEKHKEVKGVQRKGHWEKSTAGERQRVKRKRIKNGVNQPKHGANILRKITVKRVFGKRKQNWDERLADGADQQKDGVKYAKLYVKNDVN